MEILRREYKDVKSFDSWTLVYGRRRVGKSFLVRKYLSYDLYFLVTRDLQAYFPTEGKFTSLDEAFRLAVSNLREGKTVVIDEFQRLPAKYWDGLASEHPNGKLILVGSSFRVMRELVDKRSPLLGLVFPYRLGLIHYADVLSQVDDPVLAMVYKDPWTVGFVKSVEDLKEKAFELYTVTKALISEVFEEEERQLTNLYEAVLLSLAEGEWNTAIIANSLNSRGFNVTASTVSSYLDTLQGMGLVEKLKVFGERRRARWYYRISSPIISLMLYAEAKYSVSFTEQVGELPIGREVQFAVGELLAEHHDAELAYSPYEDIDVVLMKGDRPVIGYEVKLGEFSRGEAERAVERIRSAGIPRAGLVSLSERPEFDADETLGPEELRELAKGIAEKVLREE